MRFGVGGDLLPGHIDEFGEAHASLVRRLGFSGCFTNFGLDDPFATSDASIRRVRAILDDYGLEMVQSIGTPATPVQAAWHSRSTSPRPIRVGRLEPPPFA